jgi:hypothetical protein
MIATLRKGRLALATSSFVAFRTSRVCTSLTQDGRDRSSSRGLQDKDLIDFSTPMVRMYPIHGISNTCDGSTPKQFRVQFLYASRASFIFLGRFGSFMPHNPKCKFLNTNAAALATSKLSTNRLLAKWHMGRRDDNRVFPNWFGPSGSVSI